MESELLMPKIDDLEGSSQLFGLLKHALAKLDNRNEHVAGAYLAMAIEALESTRTTQPRPDA